MGLTREEAKKHFSYLYEDGFCKNDLMVGLEQIYNDHEAKIKAKDEEIERLKASVKQWQQNFLDA